MISARDLSNPTFEFNGTTGPYVAPAAEFFGGPADFLFGPDGDTGDLTVLGDAVVLSDSNAGPVTFRFPTSFISDLGQAYDVRSLPNAATIDPAAVTITIDPATKTYGDLFTFADVSFTDTGFVGGDGIDTADVDSLGAPELAEVTALPYALDLINFIGTIGTDLANYDITTVPSTLTVDPAPLTIDVNDLTKTFGTEIIFNGTEFTTTGLVNLDTVDTLTIDSLGAPATATVAGSPYAINGSAPVGTGLTNYTITINPGVLTVNGAPVDPLDPLDIFISNASKVYGETLTFSGTEFTVSGLMGGDTLTSLTITSAGAAADAPVSDSPYQITGSNPVGSGLENYILNITPGFLTITPAPLTITANDQTKDRGTAFTFTGNEFTVEGLLNADVVTSATLSSVATDAGAGVTGEAGAAILITDPQGNGLTNYAITLVGGVFIVAPADVTITINVNDQTKVYGTEFEFNGTEFTVEGLDEGDSIESITLSSEGANAFATVSSGPFTIFGSNPVGTGLDKYTFVFENGSFEVLRAPLSVTALDQTKEEGLEFTFAGTEFAADGLLNNDAVTSAVLTSAGAAAAASAEDSPFAIAISGLNGIGLDNYDIATTDGAFDVLPRAVEVLPPIINPVRSGNLSISNPGDSISIVFPGDADVGTIQEQGSGGGSGAAQSLQNAQETTVVVDAASGELETAISSCGSSDQDFANYLTCLSQSLDTYSNALDQIANDLPSGLETVSAVIQKARVGVDAAASRAQRRLAGATSDAERQAIRSDALNEARGAIDEAKEEIRKTIALIRADDPEVAAVQRQTGARIVQAFDTVDGELLRAVEL